MNCAGCHRRIDPLGLAFDNYDAIGRWRDVETVRDGTGDNPRLDPSGELPDGRKFADAGALKNARYLEPLAGLYIWFGYGAGQGTAIAPAWIRQAA